MKSLLTFVTLIFPLTSLAFVAKDQQPAFVDALNKVQPSFSYAESIRCSVRNRACVVKLTLHNAHEVSCVISGLNDGEEVYDTAEDGQIKIAPFFVQKLDRCLASQ